MRFVACGTNCMQNRYNACLGLRFGLTPIRICIGNRGNLPFSRKKGLKPVAECTHVL